MYCATTVSVSVAAWMHGAWMQKKKSVCIKIIEDIYIMPRVPSDKIHFHILKMLKSKVINTTKSFIKWKANIIKFNFVCCIILNFINNLFL